MIFTLQFQGQTNRRVSLLLHALWSLLVQINSLLQTCSTMFNNINHNVPKNTSQIVYSFPFQTAACCFVVLRQTPHLSDKALCKSNAFFLGLDQFWFLHVLIIVCATAGMWYLSIIYNQLQILQFSCFSKNFA